ncbi:MAG: SBBP repeat-containing protein, partial [Chloroflexota bacterium]
MNRTRFFSSIFVVLALIFSLIPTQPAQAATYAEGWLAFLGGGGLDYGLASVVGAGGDVYVAGRSTADWGSPVRGFTASSSEAFAAKFDPDGVLLWSTFLGGSGSDYGNAIAVDSAGNTYVAGFSTAAWSCSPTPCTVSAFTSSGYEAFVAKIDSSGNLVWNTFLGGSGSDFGYGVGLATDASGNVYLAGRSSATWGSPVRAYAGGYDAFAAKLDSGGSLLWHTFLGGPGSDASSAIAVDAGGNAFISGRSGTGWGTPVQAFLGGNDAFAAKLDSSGSLLWHTFLGSYGDDGGNGIAVDASGNAYVSGFSDSSWGAPAEPFTDLEDAFAAKLTGADGSLAWNTFLGGSGSDFGFGAAVSGSALYVTGNSNAAWGSPARPFAVNDAFVANLNPADGSLAWNTFLGGPGSDNGYGLATDAGGNAYLAGQSDAAWGTPSRAYSSANEAFIARVDVAPPTVASITPADPNPTNAASVDFTVTFSEFVTGVDASDFSLAVSGITGASVSGVSGSGAAYTVTVDTGSGDGTIRLDLNDDDSILDAIGNHLGGSGPGNGGYTGGGSYTVMKTAPVVTSVLRANPDPTSAPSVDFTVTFSAPVTGVDNTDFAVTASGVTGAAVTGVSGSGTTYTVSVDTGSGDGTIRLDVLDDDSITDATGNPLNGGYTGGESYTVDKSAPETQIDTMPADPSSSRDASFTFSSPDATATFECRLDGGGFGPCASPASYTGLGDGPHTFEVRAVDPAGNTDPTPASYAWTIDATTPETQIDTHPADPSSSADASFTFSSPDLTATFECQLDGSGGFAPCASPLDYFGLADGPHTFEVRGVDTLGNTDPTPASFAWTIDTAAPDTQIDTMPADPSNSADASFSFSSPNGGVTFECRLDGGFVPCVSPSNYTGLADGPHIFEVRASDAAGNVDPTPASYAWTIDTFAPDTQIDSFPADPSSSADASFTFSSPDGGLTFACQLDGGGFAPCVSPANYAGLADGPHTFDVRATDAAGNTDPTPASYGWTIDTLTPDTQIDSFPADPSSSADASFTFSSPNGGLAFACRLDGGGFAPCVIPAEYFGLADGPHTFEVIATDAAGNTDPTPASYTWTIDTLAPDTQIDTMPADPSNSRDAGFNFSSPDATATFQCQLDGGGFLPCISPAIYFGLGD